MGPGAAFARGFLYLNDIIQETDIVVTMEGDNTSKCETLETMIERLKRENLDSVFASPYAYGGGFSQTDVIRILLSHFANSFIKIFLKINGIHTYSSFFRVYNGAAIKKLQFRFGPNIINSIGFECMIELVAKIMHLKLGISEVPMEVDWSLRKGKSKMKILKTIFGYLRLFIFLRKELINT